MHMLKCEIPGVYYLKCGEHFGLDMLDFHSNFLITHYNMCIKTKVFYIYI